MDQINAELGKETMIVLPCGPVIGRRRGGVTAFHRVPYAMAPIGPRRFAVPVPPAPWSAPRDCTRPGPMPPQLPSRLAKVMGEYDCAQDEDCLHLDIWVPADAGKGTPVFVFLHGGAFMTGGGSMPCYDGHALAEASGMIVVTVSYRLGALGFLPIAGIAPANLGLHDQLAALRFIREAAPALGGDPETITVAGQSAGAYSIALMLANGLGRDLFRRAILMSAPLGLDLPHEGQTADLAERYLAALDIASGDRDALNRVPVAALLRAQAEVARADARQPGDIAPPFLPVIDGDLVTGDPNAALGAGAAAWCDVVIGSTREEMAAFYVDNPALAAIGDDVVAGAFQRAYGAGAAVELEKARARRAPALPPAVLGDLVTDRLFARPNLDFAAAQTAHGGAAHAYRFDWQSPMPGVGACHCIDLPFLFGAGEIWLDAPMVASADRREILDLARLFSGSLAAFAATGDPNRAGLPVWPAFGQARMVQFFDRLTEASSPVG